ncbi:MAG: hypothetical protein Q9187_006266 [Circinaria calcarea]
MTSSQRWKRAQSLPDGYAYGTKETPSDFTKLSAVCPQAIYNPDDSLDPSQMSEDCLQCNIWVPAGERPEQGWPVWVYLHGGFLQWGSPNTLNPCNLLGETDVQCIIVMPVYRLNLFGFLASKELLQDSVMREDGTVGDLGFWDQRLAIEWTFKHVSGFGGNKNNITLGGLSAGAHSVFHQLSYVLSLPGNQSIIRRVTMYSNGPGVQPRSILEAQEQFNELVAALGISKELAAAEKLIRLKALPWTELIAASGKMRMNSFRAVTDGGFVRRTLFQEIQDGQFGKSMARRGIKILIGDLPDEVSVYRLENPPSSHEGLFERLRVEYPLAVTKTLMKLYCPTKALPSGGSWQDLFGRIYADVQVHMTERGFIAALAQSLPLSHIYRYRIDWRPKCVDLFYPKEWGVTHGSDLTIWFYGNGASLASDERILIQQFLKPFAAYLKGEEPSWETQSIHQAKAILPNGSLGFLEDKEWDRCLQLWNQLQNTESILL